MNAMKKTLTCAVFVLSVCTAIHANEVLKEGYKAGQWTQDYDAAMAKAKKAGMPILLNFTGSDWCGWCKKMDAEVFSKPEWTKYAAANIALAFIDFPKDKSKVPEKFVARNRELSEKYGVRGYPTYVLLDSSNGAELGRLNAQDNTPAKFIGKVNELKRFTVAGLKKLSASDPAMKKTADGYIATKAEIATLEEKLEAARKKQEKLRAELDELFVQAKAKELGNKGPAYLAARKELKTAKEALEAWIATGPQRNAETMKKYQAFQKRISDAAQKLSEF